VVGALEPAEQTARADALREVHDALLVSDGADLTER
jgi:hypothetical protein